MISWPNWRSRMPARARSALDGDEAEEVPLGRGRFPAEQEIRGAQVEEAQGMALDELAQVHQPAKLLGGRGDVRRP